MLAEVERQHLPSPTTQCPIEEPTGRTIHLDFGWLVPRVSKIDVSGNLADALGNMSEILRQRGARF